MLTDIKSLARNSTVTETYTTAFPGLLDPVTFNLLPIHNCMHLLLENLYVTGNEAYLTVAYLDSQIADSDNNPSSIESMQLGRVQ